MNWLFIIVLIFILLLAIHGAGIGLVRTMLGIGFLVASLVLSSVASPYAADLLKEHTGVYRMVQESSYTYIEDRMKKSVGDLDMSQEVDFIEALSLPSGVKDAMLKSNNSTGYEAYAVDQFSGYLSEILADLLVNSLAFFLVYVLLNLLFHLLLRLTDKLTMLPGLSFFNRLGGFLLGAMKALFWIWVFMLLLTLLRNTTAGGILLELTGDNVFLDILYRNNPLWYLLEML